MSSISSIKILINDQNKTIYQFEYGVTLMQCNSTVDTNSSSWHKLKQLTQTQAADTNLSSW